MQYKVLGAGVCAGLLFASPVLAQVTPSDVRDLVGARAAGGESELASRGYVNVGGQKSDDRSYTYWWKDSSGVCLSVATVNGRYDSIVSTPAPDCRRDNSGGGSGYQPHPSYRSDNGNYSEHIALICYGEGKKLENHYTSGYEWNSDKKRYESRTGTELRSEDYDTSVAIQIDGNRGQIKPAKNMVPPLHSDSDNGWYDIKDLSISRDTIRGSFKFNGMNHPNLVIDRRAGHITLDGLSKFSGECTPMDQDRKF